jgi:peroxiredoxin
MRNMPKMFIAIVLICTAERLHAGEYNEVLNIGDAAPAWKGLAGVDGKQYSLADLKDKAVVVIVFTCNTCPVAADYEERINKFAKQHAKDVALVAINSNAVAGDQLDKMKERAEEKKFDFPYLRDDTQETAKTYGAIFTPEFFVLDRERKIVYMGAMDDKTDPQEAKVNYLEKAIQAALDGKQPDVKETVARGCRIRFPRRAGK